MVFGAGGNRDAGKRAPMGQAAAELADLVVVTDDNPRDEEPADIRAAIVAGARPGGAAEIVEIGDRRAAIDFAVRWAEKATSCWWRARVTRRARRVTARRGPSTTVTSWPWHSQALGTPS